MLNINNLESRWLKYKLYSYIPKVIILLIALLSILGFIFFDNPINLDTKTASSIQVIEQKQVTKIDQEQTLNSEQTYKEEIKKEEKKAIILTPSLEFIDKLQQSSPRYYNQHTAQKKVTQTHLQTKPKNSQLSSAEKKITDSKQHNITIDRKNLQKDINHVLNRFEKSKNPVLSLFIAKKYYDMQDYKKAYKYALITNDLDNEIEESWLVFAKSLYMLDKKEKAMQVLTQYVSKHNSHNAQILLQQMQNGGNI